MNEAKEIIKAMCEAAMAKIKELEEEPTQEPKPKKATTTATTTTKKKKSAATAKAEEPTSEPQPTEEAQPVVEKTPAAEETKSEPLTLEQIRSVLQTKRAEGKRDKFKALFESFGVQRLPDVNPADYEKLLSAAEAL